jgi:hypothetical protein
MGFLTAVPTPERQLCWTCWARAVLWMRGRRVVRPPAGLLEVRSRGALPGAPAREARRSRSTRIRALPGVPGPGALAPAPKTLRQLLAPASTPAQRGGRTGQECVGGGDELPGDARITSISERVVVADAAAPCWLVLADSFDPG